MSGVNFSSSNRSRTASKVPAAPHRVRRQLGQPGHRLPGAEPQDLGQPSAASRVGARAVLRREIRRFLTEIVLLSAQILRAGRGLVFRLLVVKRWVPLLLDGTQRLKHLRLA